jgi:hypothetical protein
MKEQLNIDALFQKAANAPSTSSFGETKELFQSTVGITKVNFEPGKYRVLTLKNALIMLAIVGTIITVIFLIPGIDLNENQSNKEAVVVPNAGDKDSTETIRSQVVLIESEVESIENKEAMFEKSTFRSKKNEAVEICTCLPTARALGRAKIGE